MDLRNAGRIVPLLLLMVFCAPNALAWDEVGHKLTAIIAWQQMKPEIRARVFDILLKAPEDSHLNTPYDAFNSRSTEIKRLELFMHASIWPDVIKNRAFTNRYEKYNNSDWHYGDIFWKQVDGKSEVLKGFDGAGGIVVSKLTDFERILKDDRSKDHEKAVAIAWFLHTAGDIHNPLHNASRVTETEPAGDQGGNLFVLVPRTQNDFGVNLHSYWDSIIGRQKPRKNDAWDTDYLMPIARKFVKKHKLESFRQELDLGDYDGWNMEGFAFLDTHVYDDIERGKLPSGKYQKRAYKLAREQIVLAGYRIGETFNEIFSEDKNTS